MGATPRRDGPGRRLFVAALAAACAFGVALPEAGAQEGAEEEERPGLGDLLAPITPDEDDDAEPDAPPATIAPSEPGAPAEPPPGSGEAPPPEGEAPPAAAPAQADVQGAQAAPRRPRSGSADGPGLQSGGPPPAGAGDDAMPLEVAPPSVAPPEATVPQAAPPAGDVTGQEMAAQPTATGAYPTEPAMPDVTVLGLLALGLLWFDRRYRARYRLPPQ